MINFNISLTKWGAINQNIVLGIFPFPCKQGEKHIENIRLDIIDYWIWNFLEEPRFQGVFLNFYLIYF